MAEPEGLGRKKRIRAGHKASATRILRQVDEIADCDEVTETDRSRLAQLKGGEVSYAEATGCRRRSP